MARSGKYPKRPCSHCGKVVSTFGAGRTNHMKHCVGAKKTSRHMKRIFKTAYEIAMKENPHAE